MSKAARLARRHGLGPPVRTYRQSFPLWWHLLWIAMALVILVSVGVNQNLDGLTKAWGAAIPLLVGLVLWWLLTDVRLVLCEGGVVIGRFFPLLSPSVIPYGAIEPRGVTCVSDVGRFSKVSGREFGSTLFSFPQSRRGLLFDGPPAKAVRRRSGALASMFDSPPDTVRGGKLWAFAYRGRPEDLLAVMHRGMVGVGVPFAEALPGAALPERGVGASRDEARARINGFAP